MTIKSISSLDEARAAHPELTLCLYAYAGNDVTLEIITPDEEIYRFDGPNEAAVFAAAFPPAEPAPTPDIFD